MHQSNRTKQAATMASAPGTAAAAAVSSAAVSSSAGADGSQEQQQPFIGVLALQGAFHEHAKILQETGIRTREVNWRDRSLLGRVAERGAPRRAAGLPCALIGRTHA